MLTLGVWGLALSFGERMGMNVKSIWRPLGGVALAALLVLTAVPAQALDAVNDVTGAESASADAHGDVAQPADADAVDAAADATAESDGAAGGVDADAGATADDAAGETASDVEDADGVSASADGHAHDHDAAATDDSLRTVEPVEEAAPLPEPGDVTEVPDTVVLNGRVILLPDEPSVSEPGASVGGGVLIGTDDGTFVPVDADSFGSALQPDAQFAGVATLNATARDAVAASLAASETGSLSADDVLEAVSASVGESEEALPVTGETAAPEAEPFAESGDAAGAPLGGAPAARAHTVDAVYFTGSTSSYGNRAFTESQLKSLVTQSGSYWKTQSDGSVPSITTSRFKKLTATASSCTPSSLWTQAAKAYGTNANSYTNGRHLVVFVDSRYGCSMAGLAGIGTSIHTGGTVWVDLGSYGGRGTAANQDTVNKSLTTLAHELGHNMSLGHAQARVCSGTTTDQRVGWYADSQNPNTLRVLKPSGSPCQDVEYGDTWSLMGSGGSANSKPPALGVAHRTALGVNPSGSVRTVVVKGGRSQTFTLNALGSANGLRGLKITNNFGEVFYVEYRGSTGQDSQLMGGRSSFASPYGGSIVSTGVQVSKSYPTAQARWSDGVYRPYAAKRSTSLTANQAGKKALDFKAGTVSLPIDSNARVRVTQLTSTTAKVTVEFSPFIDIPYNHKFGTEINWMSSSGLSTGINAGSGLRKYDAKSNVTREAMAAFLYRLNTPKGATAPKGYKIPKKSPFIDVPTNHKFYKEIAWMYTSKLSTGISTPSGRAYAPKSGVTREAMAAFLYRMDKSTYKGASTSQFSDVRRGDKFYKEISWMYQSGLSTGVKQPSGKPQYQPKNNVSREAMAAFIYRYKH